MADIRIRQLPDGSGPVASDFVALDNGTTRRATVQQVVEIGRPAASQAEAEAGTNPTKAMTPLTTKQSIASEIGVSIASAAQGALADGAAQKSQNLNDLSDKATARLNVKVSTYVSDRTALKALDTTKDILAYLKEDGREGIFEWTSGDFSAQITADTLEGVYVKADAIASTAGAWVRQGFTELLPKWFGAVVNSGATDSGPAIQAAIDIGNLIKVPVRLPIGTLYTAQTLHVYAQSVLLGYGKSQSFIKAKDGSGAFADGKGILETFNFLSLIDTATKFVTDSGMTWGFVLKGFTVDGNRQVNYGGVSGTRFAGVGTGVWDGFGIRLYGRRYIVQDIAVNNCAGIGFYSECGNPTVASPSDWYYNALNDQQGHIEDVIISLCSYEGFVFRGPGDIRINDVTAFLCNYPDETLYGTARASLMFPTENISGMVWADKTVTGGVAIAGCEIGFVHSHTHKNGYGIRFQGDVFLRIRADNLTSEGNLGAIKVRGQTLGQLNKVNVRNMNFGPGAVPDFDLESTDLLYIGEYENRATSGNAGSIRLRVGADKAQFGTITIHGGTAGHGVVIDTNVDHVLINQMYIHDLRGTAQDGNVSRAFWTKSGATNIYVGSVMLTDNDRGWRNDSSGEIVIARGRIEANAGTFPTSAPLDLATSPTGNALRQCGFTTFDATTTRANTFSGNSSVDPTLTTEQTITWTHNMWRTPNLNEMSHGYTTNGANRPTLQYDEVIAPTSTLLSMRVKFSAAGNGTSGGSAFAAKI